MFRRLHEWLDQHETPLETLNASERVQEERVQRLRRQFLRTVSEWTRLTQEWTRAERQAARLRALCARMPQALSLERKAAQSASLLARERDQCRIRLQTLQADIHAAQQQLQRFRAVRPAIQAAWEHERLLQRHTSMR